MKNVPAIGILTGTGSHGPQSKVKSQKPKVKSQLQWSHHGQKSKVKSLKPEVKSRKSKVKSQRAPWDRTGTGPALIHRNIMILIPAETPGQYLSFAMFKP